MLGIDLGTTGIKALLIDAESGVALARAYRSYPSATVVEGQYEQDPDDWWHSCAAVTREVLAGVPSESVVGVGLSGHMHGVVLVDDHGRPVRPAMTWADRRDVSQVARLRAAGTQFADRCANPVVEAFTAPKLAWVADHEPSVLRRAVRLVQAKDSLRYRLTDTWGTDLTDARGTLLYDVHRDAWDPELWELCGASPQLAPAVATSTTVVGSVTAAAAAVTGLAPGTAVVAGAGDVACSALGAGVVDEGVVQLNVGTAAQVTTVLPELVAGDHFVFGRADSSGFLAMASVYAAGLGVDWAARTILDDQEAGSPPGMPPGQWVDELAHGEGVGAGGVTFLPHLLGTSVPTHEPAVRGALLGIGPETNRPALARAILEGVAFACADAVETVAAVGGGLRRVHVGGGLTRSSVWSETVAAVLDVPIYRVGQDASARGAAMLAGLGLGVWTTAAEAAAACLTAERLPAPTGDSRRDSRGARAAYEQASEVLLELARRQRRAEGEASP